MAATYPLLIKESYGQLIPRDTLWIQKVWSIATSFFLNCKLVWIGSFRFGYIIWKKIYLRSCSDWLALTLDSWPRKRTESFSTRAPSWTINNSPKRKGSYVKTMSRQEHLHHLLLDKWKMVDEKIHKGSYPSSHTLLSTTSFQTKFYHNIPLIWNWIDSIVESWIVIGWVVHSRRTLDLIFSMYV